MNTSIRLSEYSTAPLYNIKAVVQATGISPSTLRAWERRYHMCNPQRSESGYRLYSDRDVAVIRWLKAQVDAGMAISQAVAWLESLGSARTPAEQAVLPTAGVHGHEERTITYGSDEIRTFAALQADLTRALIGFDEVGAENIMAEAFAMYPLEQVGEELVTPVLVEIGERWHRNELSVTREHFATNYLLHRLASLLRTVPNLDGGPTLWVGCAPGELHEGGAILLAIYLRRAGYHIHYLGQNLPVDDFVGEVRRRRPAMVLLSASTAEALPGLKRMAEEIAVLDLPRPVIGYGGRIFVRHPELRDQIPGLYLGDSAQSSLATLKRVLEETPGKSRSHSLDAAANE